MEEIRFEEIKITQYLISLIAGSFLIITNLIHGWGEYESQQIAVPIFILYNIIDIVIGKYWNNNLIYMTHHMTIIILGIYFIFLEEFTRKQYLISYYITLGEISSILNNIRWFYRNTLWQKNVDILFAISFILFRSISNIGMIYNLENNIYLENSIENRLIKITIVYTALNLYWGFLIINKLRKMA